MKSPFVSFYKKKIFFFNNNNHFQECSIRLLQLFKKSKFKKNLKTTSNEKLLRATSKYIFLEQRENLLYILLY